MGLRLLLERKRAILKVSTSAAVLGCINFAAVITVSIVRRRVLRRRAGMCTVLLLLVTAADNLAIAAIITGAARKWALASKEFHCLVYRRHHQDR